MKKKLISMMLTAAMVASLCACGGDNSASSNTDSGQSSGNASTESSDSQSGDGQQTQAPEGTTTIEVWTNDRHDLEYVESMIEQYNQSNSDGIFINLSVITEDYQNMLALAYNGGTAPDVVGANSLPLNTFADTGILIPLNDYIDADETFQTVNEPYEHAVMKGKLFFSLSSLGNLFYAHFF
ncbi:MAG: hypothetical protein K2G55_07500 [Lachnospiraceae bacterium]|nr:hypothetical protein [Lachnospiraceae bacterium]